MTDPTDETRRGREWPSELLCPAGDRLEIEEAYDALAYLLGPGSPSRDGWTRLDAGEVARALHRLDEAHDVMADAVLALLPAPHPRGGTLRARVEALAADWSALCIPVTPAPTETCRGIGDQHLCTPACAHDRQPVDPPRQSCGCPPIAHRQRHLHPEACAAVEAPSVAGVRDGEDWTAFTETPCEDDIAHDRHVWRGLFPDPRLCPGVPSDFEVAVAVAARLAECTHLFARRTCTRCGRTMPPAAAEPASEARPLQCAPCGRCEGDPMCDVDCPREACDEGRPPGRRRGRPVETRRANLGPSPCGDPYCQCPDPCESFGCRCPE